MQGNETRHCGIEKDKIMATVNATNDSFKSEVLDADTPVVVDFWAEWCGPCKMIAPSLDEISAEMSGKVKIVKVNIDENPDLAVEYGVRSIPMLLAFKGGEKVNEMVGAKPKSGLQTWIDGAIA